jgi:hypothetical protein
MRQQKFSMAGGAQRAEAGICVEKGLNLRL